MGAVSGLLIGYATVIAVLFVGYSSRRLRASTDTTIQVLNKLTISILMPSLYVVVLAGANPEQLVSSYALATAAPSLMCIALGLGVLRVFRRHLPKAERMMLAISGVFVNSGNIGIPIAISVLGATSYLAPVMLVQVLVVSPAMIVALSILTESDVSPWRSLVQALAKPVVLASVVGVGLSLIPGGVPEELLGPLRLLGQASIPIVLLAFGMSIPGARPFATGPCAGEVWFSVAVKVLIFPCLTLLAGVLLGLTGPDLLALVVIAALPTAQNLHAVAGSFGVKAGRIRDVILISTGLSLPAALGIVLFL